MTNFPNIDTSALSNEQIMAVETFIKGENVFVTGGAGSGKSYLLHFLKRNFSHLGLEITASTGIAAVNIGGVTINSWSGIGLANLPVFEIINNLLSKKMSRVRRKIIKAKALAIDEISMISSDVFEILDQVFKVVRQNDLPMGGLQLVLFGDFLQLPPIQKDGREISFCFDSKAWKTLNLKVFALNKIFRQRDERFIRILNNLRLGKIEEEDVEILSSRINAKDNNSAIRPTILTTHNYKVEKINQEELKKIPQLETVFQAIYSGDIYKIEFLKKNCIASDALKLKVGAQVMMIKNTYQKEGIINGSLGIVRDFSPKKNYPIVEFSNGKILSIAPEEWLVERFDEEKKAVVTDAALVQIPLVLAWAMTIHKSQGLTLDKISCDLSDVFADGQAYVALSRAVSLDGVFINSVNFNRIKSNADAVRFYEMVCGS